MVHTLRQRWGHGGAQDGDRDVVGVKAMPSEGGPLPASSRSAMAIELLVFVSRLSCKCYFPSGERGMGDRISVEITQSRRTRRRRRRKGRKRRRSSNSIPVR